MLFKIIRKIISPIEGKKIFQKMFASLHSYSLAGMNMGGGGNPKRSGESKAMAYIDKRFKSTNQLIVFDVGANIGQYSKLLIKVFGKKAIIHSFEPSLKTYQKLKLNIEENRDVNLYNFGFGNEPSKVILFTNADESGLASVYQRKLDHFNIQMDISEEIEINTIDAFCTEKKIKHIHFLKLDVEGHELKVLEGASKMLNSGSIDFIQFEFGGCNIDSRTYFQDFYYLLKDHYQIYRIVKNGLYPINEYKEMYEVFTTTNFLAEKIAIRE